MNSRKVRRRGEEPLAYFCVILLESVLELMLELMLEYVAFVLEYEV